MLNSIFLHGRLTADPELKQTQSGVSLCNFSIAVDRSYKNGEDKMTDFFNCTAWRGLGEMIAKHFKKGKEIVLSGEMQSQRWQDTDGNNRISWVVSVNSVDFCGSKKEGNPSVNVDPNNDPLLDFAKSNGFEAVEGADDDLPF